MQQEPNVVGTCASAHRELTIPAAQREWMESWPFQYAEMAKKGRKVALTTYIVVQGKDEKEASVVRLMTDGHYVYSSWYGGGGFSQVWDEGNPAYAVTHTGTAEELQDKMRARLEQCGWWIDPNQPAKEGAPCTSTP